MENPVGIDVEADLDLWNASGRRRDTVQMETADGLVVNGHGPLALQYVDLNRWLVVRCR